MLFRKLPRYPVDLRATSKLNRMNTESFEAKLQERYSAGERGFVGMELDDRPYDFAGANLAEADFTGSFITANFRGASLRGAVFANCNLKTSDFRDADLTNVSFRGAAIDGAEFGGALLAGATFEDASEHGHIYAKAESPHAV
jgi:uncharacterized protein YjbI with pentapeptide repeats